MFELFLGGLSLLMANEAEEGSVQRQFAVGVASICCFSSLKALTSPETES